MTSSSRRKRRTTGWSSSRLLLPAALAAAAALASLPAGGCTRSRELFVTYFNGDHGLSLRHPATWRTDQAEQEGVWYRYFLPPPAAGESRSPVSVTLLAGPISGELDAYAERYLAGHQLSNSGAEERQGVSGKSWAFAAADGATRYRLSLFKVNDKVVGLYAQGDAAGYEREARTIDEIWASLTFERPERYPRQEFAAQHASLGIPDSWRQTRACTPDSSDSSRLSRVSPSGVPRSAAASVALRRASHPSCRRSQARSAGIELSMRRSWRASGRP